MAAGLFAQPDLASLKAAYDRLSPEPYIAARDVALFTSLQVRESLLSCPVRAGALRVSRDGECRWLRFAGSKQSQDSTSQNLGFDETSAELSRAIQTQLSPQLHLGLGFGYRDSRLEVGDDAHADGDLLQAAVELRRSIGPARIVASLGGGRIWYDSSRIINVAEGGGAAAGDGHVDFASMHLRIARAFEEGDAYLRPMLDAAVTRLHGNSFSETGAGGANLLLESET